MKKTLLLAAFSATTLLTSCSKDKDNNNNTGTKEHLTTGKWRMSAYTETGVNSSGQTDTITTFDQISPCSKDNFYIYNTDGTYTANEGATICHTGDAQQTTGTWQLIDGNSKLVQDLDTSNIVQLSATTLRISYDFTSSGKPRHEDITFTNF